MLRQPGSCAVPGHRCWVPRRLGGLHAQPVHHWEAQLAAPRADGSKLRGCREHCFFLPGRDHDWHRGGVSALQCRPGQCGISYCRHARGFCHLGHSVDHLLLPVYNPRGLLVGSMGRYVDVQPSCAWLRLGGVQKSLHFGSAARGLDARDRGHAHQLRRGHHPETCRQGIPFLGSFRPRDERCRRQPRGRADLQDLHGPARQRLPRDDADEATYVQEQA
mmetsp:Transcript_6660/g.16621  ORF Transcript_6660/g.16621 Transcript_6660/m.16621 type:complete len:219 (+) Transcript_6660:448-1104(+)